jgi:ABC-type transporter Mla maintaining outer membrane lipid asymmetry ATPase subunit MlaF
VVSAGDGLVLEGFDAGAAELLIHLVTGAAVPDEGQVRIAGRETREIATDTEWLQSLDLFGLVTDRAVLIGSLTVASNLALPMTLAIDPMTSEVRARVDALAAEVGLTQAALGGPANELATPDRMRLHLARALAVGPQVLLLEHPTAPFEESDARAAFGVTVRRIAAARRLAWVALSNDDAFARATAGRRLVLERTTGRIVARSFWQRWRS